MIEKTIGLDLANVLAYPNKEITLENLFDRSSHITGINTEKSKDSIKQHTQKYGTTEKALKNFHELYPQLNIPKEEKKKLSEQFRDEVSKTFWIMYKDVPKFAKLAINNKNNLYIITHVYRQIIERFLINNFLDSYFKGIIYSEEGRRKDKGGLLYDDFLDEIKIINKERIFMIDDREENLREAEKRNISPILLKRDLGVTSSISNYDIFTSLDDITKFIEKI